MANGYVPILAIDFDGTIKKNKELKDYTGGLQPDCYDILHKLKSEGCKLILWTCRSGEHLEKAKGFLKEYGLLELFDKFNENVDGMFTTSGKVYADYYIDDLNVGGFIGWKKVGKIVMKDGYFKARDDFDYDVLY